MPTVRKTIALTEQQDKWIKAQIAAGEYTNDSEIFRDLIWREQVRRSEIEAIRAALIEGENSGEPRRVDAPKFNKRMRAAHG